MKTLPTTPLRPRPAPLRTDGRGGCAELRRAGCGSAPGPAGPPALVPPRGLAAAVLGLLLLAGPVAAGSPAATLLWQREAPGRGSALLLVLEQSPEGWRLLDLRTAAGPAKVRRTSAPAEGPIWALVDARGAPLAAGRLRLPEALHGPVLDEEGELRCVAVPLERRVLPARLPQPAGAAALLLFDAAPFAPTDGAALAAALAARPADAGLLLRARFPLEEREEH